MLQRTVCTATDFLQARSCSSCWIRTLKLVDTHPSDDKVVERTLTLSPLNWCTPTNHTDKTIATLDDLVRSFSNFTKPKSYYRQKVLDGNHELKEIYNGDEQVVKAFRLIFPEIVQSRGTTQLKERDRDGQVFIRWSQGNNQVEIEFEEEGSKQERGDKSKHINALFIGGPSVLVASVLYQMRYMDERILHAYADRLDSNFDGSAYYYHQRHAVPVYASPVNRGHYYLYIDLYKRLVSKKRLAHLAETDRNHVKLSLSWANIKFRYIFTIFIPNMWHMAHDIWFIRDKKKSKMAQSMEHSFRTVPVVEAISKHCGVPMESMLVRGKDKSNYVAFPGEDAPGHFHWMGKFGDLPFSEVSSDGFGNEVTQVLDFPNDGIIAPMVMENLRATLAKRTKTTDLNDISQPYFQLKKLYVIPDPANSECIRVSAVEWIDTRTSVRHHATVDRVFISLGPSGTVNVIPPKLSWSQHARDCLRKAGAVHYHPTKFYGGYQPTFASLWRHSLNMVNRAFFRGTQCLKDFGLAAGSTSVLMLGVDSEQASAAQLDVFSRFLEGLNQHWTLIAQRDVTLPESNDKNARIRHYRFFAIQMTGGGNFPSRYSKPDYLVSLLASTEKIYGFDKIQHHAIYDIVQSRGCGRAVSAQNTAAFQHLGSNAVISYALGGIGMTTMFSNGEKLVQMVEERDRLLEPKAKQNQGSRPAQNVLDGINYSYMVGDPNKVARALGMVNTMTKGEKIGVFVPLTTLTIALAFFSSFF